MKGQGPYYNNRRMFDPFPLTGARESAIAGLVSKFKIDTRALANMIGAMTTRGSSRGG